MLDKKLEYEKNNGIKVYFDEKDIKKILIQCLKGLKHLKSFNIYHRDLKPNNILVKNEKNLDIELGDFGMTKKIESYYAKINT